MAMDPAKLGAGARSLVLDAEVSRLVSAASILELGIKHRLGELAQAAPVLADLPQAFAGWAARELPMTAAQAALAGALDWEHRDPFDRILAAQAIMEGAVLVSKDTAFDTAPGLRRVW
jgi:PIN domain nuclease of toxin-antitoxin system